MFADRLLCACSFLTLPLPALAQEAEWKVGLARVKVTPQQPVFMSGYASRNKPFEGVHDDLFAKALVLEDAAGTRAVLVTTDLIGFSAAIGNPIRERIAKETGIAATSVLLNSSHTHTGPDAEPRSEAAKAAARWPTSERTVAYTKQVQDKRGAGRQAKQRASSSRPGCRGAAASSTF